MGAFPFSRHVTDFCDGRRSFPTNENSNLYHSGHRHPSVMDFAQCQSPKLLGSSPLSQINIHNRKNLEQTSGAYPIYRQNLGWSQKSKIPDRLGFSRHMKTTQGFCDSEPALAMEHTPTEMLNSPYPLPLSKGPVNTKLHSFYVRVALLLMQLRQLSAILRMTRLLMQVMVQFLQRS